MLVDALTIFLGAFLLFEVQPLIGKAILPWFGGAPAVWTTCLLFFQVALLAGYLYADGLIRRLSPRKGYLLHAALLVASLVALTVPIARGRSPILPAAAWKPADPSSPVGRILALLTISIGLPYLLLASTSPLLAAWAARSGSETRVYRLYAVSNLGSLLALMTYPSVFERFLPLPRQALLWTGGYLLFAAGCLLCAWKSGKGGASQTPADPLLPLGAGARDLPYVFWFSAAACGSMLLMASTNQMCQEVAAIPFLWILPLGLYLSSFVLAFQSDRFYRRGVFLPLLAVGLGWAALVLLRGFTVPIRTQIAAYGLALFAGCMVCHGELARSKPPPARLTSFYLTVAAGGASGGIFVALVAPAIFRAYWEIHAALLLSGVIALIALVRDRSSWLHTGRPWPAFLGLAAGGLFAYIARDPKTFRSGFSGLREAFSSEAARIALAAGVVALLLLLRLRLLTTRGRPWFAGACLAGVLMLMAILLNAEIREFLSAAISLSRNFYGVLTVEKIRPDDPKETRLDLRHGRIVHGFQYQSAAKRRMPTSYYGEESGVGVALLHHPRRTAGAVRVGVVGLGVGTIAVYGRPGDLYRFYEINPGVIALSSGPESAFTYLRDSPARIQIAIGDARLSLERERAAHDTEGFDVLVVDAFTSDAIPVHLLTRQALEIDLARLAPDGILAVHISNRQLDLEPVVRALARSLDLSMCVVDRSGKGDATWATTWVLLARQGNLLASPEIARACARWGEGTTTTVWTDDQSSLLEVIR